MWRQKHCYNHLLGPGRLISDIPKRTSPQKRKKKTPERQSLLTLLLLTSINDLPSTRAQPARRTKTTSKNIFGAKRAKEIVVMTPL